MPPQPPGVPRGHRSWWWAARAEGSRQGPRSARGRTATVADEVVHIDPREELRRPDVTGDLDDLLVRGVDRQVGRAREGPFRHGGPVELQAPRAGVDRHVLGADVGDADPNERTAVDAGLVDDVVDATEVGGRVVEGDRTRGLLTAPAVAADEAIHAIARSTADTTTNGFLATDISPCLSMVRQASHGNAAQARDPHSGPPSLTRAVPVRRLAPRGRDDHHTRAARAAGCRRLACSSAATSGSGSGPSSPIGTWNSPGAPSPGARPCSGPRPRLPVVLSGHLHPLMANPYSLYGGRATPSPDDTARSDLGLARTGHRVLQPHHLRPPAAMEAVLRAVAPTPVSSNPPHSGG